MNRGFYTVVCRPTESKHPSSKDNSNPVQTPSNKDTIGEPRTRCNQGFFTVTKVQSDTKVGPTDADSEGPSNRDQGKCKFAGEEEHFGVEGLKDEDAQEMPSGSTEDEGDQARDSEAEDSACNDDEDGHVVNEKEECTAPTRKRGRPQTPSSKDTVKESRTRNLGFFTVAKDQSDMKVEPTDADSEGPPNRDPSESKFAVEGGQFGVEGPKAEDTPDEDQAEDSEAEDCACENDENGRAVNGKVECAAATRKRGRPRLSILGKGQRPAKSRWGADDKHDRARTANSGKKSGRPRKPREGSAEGPKRGAGRPVSDPTNLRLKERRMRYADPCLAKSPVGRPIKDPLALRSLDQRQQYQEKKLVNDCLQIVQGQLRDPEAQRLLVQLSKTKQGGSTLSEFGRISQAVEEVEDVRKVVEALKKGVKRLPQRASSLVKQTAVSFLPAASCVTYLGMSKRDVRNLKKIVKPSLALTSLADEHYAVFTLSELTQVTEEHCTITYLVSTRTILFEVKEAHKETFVLNLSIRADDEIGMLGVWNPALRDSLDRFWPVASVDHKKLSITLKFDLIDQAPVLPVSNEETKIVLNEVASKVLFRRWKAGEAPISRTSCEEREIYRAMFDEGTTSRSGMVTNTRLLLTSKEELYKRIVFAKYPKYLEMEIQKKPNLLTEALTSSSRTRFQEDLVLVSASNGNQDPSFGSEATRVKYCQQRYTELLAQNQLRSSQRVFEPRKRPGKVEEVALSDEQCNNIREVRPVTEKTFWSLIDNVLRIKWTSVENPTFCKICEEGPGNKRSLESARVQQVALETKIGALDLLFGSTVDEGELEKQRDASKKENAALQKERKKIKDLSAKVDHYEVHLKQKEMNRKKVQEIQHCLKPNECLVFRDFVNSYNARGKKVLNMILVVLYVLYEGQDPPCVSVVHNVSDFELDPNNKTDRFYAMDVLDFHLNPARGSKLFERFTIINISGDHGSHFSARETIYFESRVWEKYKKTIQEVSLASYHCYNRCDAAGAAVVVLAKDQAKQGADLWGARDYVECIRTYGADNTWAYEFPRINRSESLVDGYLSKKKMKKTRAGLGEEFNDEFLRRQCDIRFHYEHEGETVHLEGGIILCREVIGEGEYKVLNLGTAHQATFCKRCSNGTGNTIRKPVFHDGEKCPNLDVRTNISDGGLLASMDLAAEPSAERIRGKQILTSKKNWVDRNGKLVTRKPLDFSCKFPHCSSVYTSGGNANRHMNEKHGLWSELEVSLYVVESKKVRKKRSVQAAHKQAGTDPGHATEDAGLNLSEGAHKQPATDTAHATENMGLDLDEASQNEQGVDSESNANHGYDRLSQDESVPDLNRDEASQDESVADQTQETYPSVESCMEGYYVPRDPVEKPKANEKVYVLYPDGGIFKIFEGVCEARTIGPGHTATGCERVRFEEGCFDVDRDNIDTKKHYALLRCFITNAVLRKTKDEDIEKLELALRSCKVDFDGRRKKGMERFAEKIGEKLEPSVLQKLTQLIGQLHVLKRTTPLVPYEEKRESNKLQNAAELAKLGLNKKPGIPLTDSVLAGNAPVTVTQVKPRKPKVATNEGLERVARRSSRLQVASSSSSSSSSSSLN